MSAIATTPSGGAASPQKDISTVSSMTQKTQEEHDSEREVLRYADVGINLTDDTYRGFESAIAAREVAGEVQRGEIRAINTVAVEAAALRDNTAAITVRFVSDQINETLDRDGKPVSGTDAVTEITDLWTFERELRQPDPAWRLAAAQSG
ncbi:MAG: hypothetical protein Q9173_004545 [Seirophora scorigena]